LNLLDRGTDIEGRRIQKVAETFRRVIGSVVAQTGLNICQRPHNALSFRFIRHLKPVYHAVIESSVKKMIEFSIV